MSKFVRSIIFLTVVGTLFALAEYVAAECRTDELSSQSSVLDSPSYTRFSIPKSVPINSVNWDKGGEHLNLNYAGKLSEQNLNLSNSNNNSPIIDVIEFNGRIGDNLEVSIESNEFIPVVWMLRSKNRKDPHAFDKNSEKNQIAGFTTILTRNGYYLLAVSSYGKCGSYRVEIAKRKPLSFPQQGGRPKSNRRAVLIGINDYPGIVNDLKAPVNDVDAMYRLLHDKAGFNSSEIMVIKDVDATRANIEMAINEFLGSVTEEGTVLLYYSGHGRQLGYETNDIKEESLYLADDSDFLDYELRSRVGNIKARNVIVILDACYSGGVYRSGQDSVARPKSAPSITTMNSHLPPPKRMLKNQFSANSDFYYYLAASQDNQRAWERDKWFDLKEPRSVFTYYLIRTITEVINGNLDVSIYDVFEYAKLQTKYITVANKDFKFTEQTPWMSPRTNSNDKSIHQIFGLHNYLTSGDESLPRELPKYKGSYALLIGVYDYVEKEKYPNLQEVAKDIQKIKIALIAHGFDEVIDVLNPDYELMVKKIREFMQQYAFGDGTKFKNLNNRLLFYYAGHGEKVDGIGRLVASDAALPGENDFANSTLGLDKFEVDFVKKINTKHALFIFDMCYAGFEVTDKAERLGVEEKIFSLEELDSTKRKFTALKSHSMEIKTWPVITAGSEEEQVPDKSELNQNIIELITNTDHDYITASDIGYKLRDSIQQTEPQIRNYKNDEQDIFGEYVFYRPDPELIAKFKIEMSLL